MSECYHNYCDTSELNKTIPFANINFLEKTIQTMIDVLVDITESECIHSKRTVKHFARNLDSSFSFQEKEDVQSFKTTDQPENEQTKSETFNFLEFNCKLP